MGGRGGGEGGEEGGVCHVTQMGIGKGRYFGVGVRTEIS